MVKGLINYQGFNPIAQKPELLKMITYWQEASPQVLLWGLMPEPEEIEKDVDRAIDWVFENEV